MAWVDTCAVAAYVTKTLAQANPQFYHYAFLIIVTFDRYTRLRSVLLRRRSVPLGSIRLSSIMTVFLQI